MNDLTDPALSAETEPRGVTRTSLVYATLRRQIVHGQYRPGERLRAEMLADRYGVGHTPIREALNRLSSEGLVSQQDQRGFRVSPISRQDLLELTRTRAWITEIAIRESIANATWAWEEAIVLAFHRLSRTLKRPPAETAGINLEWERHHHAFHRALIANCPSQPLLDFSDRLFDAVDRYCNLVTVENAEPRDVLQEHLDMMEAVIGRRTADAVAIICAHAERTTQMLLPFFAEDQKASGSRAVEGD